MFLINTIFHIFNLFHNNKPYTLSTHNRKCANKMHHNLFGEAIRIRVKKFRQNLPEKCSKSPKIAITACKFSNFFREGCPRTPQSLCCLLICFKLALPKKTTLEKNVEIMVTATLLRNVFTSFGKCWYTALSGVERNLKGGGGHNFYIVFKSVFLAELIWSWLRNKKDSKTDVGKLRPAGQIRPAGPFILARRHLLKPKLPPWIKRKIMDGSDFFQKNKPQRCKIEIKNEVKTFHFGNHIRTWTVISKKKGLYHVFQSVCGPRL